MWQAGEFHKAAEAALATEPAVVKVDEAEATLGFIRAAVAEYREEPFRSADWLAMQVIDALDGHLTQGEVRHDDK